MMSVMEEIHDAFLQWVLSDEHADDETVDKWWHG